MPEHELHYIPGYILLLELFDRIVRGQSCLFTFFSFNSDSNVGFLDHTDIIASISDTQNALAEFLQESSDHLLLRRGTPAAAYAVGLHGHLHEEIPVLQLSSLS